MKNFVRRLSECTALSSGDAETLISTCMRYGVSAEDISIAIEDAEMGGSKINDLVVAIEIGKLRDIQEPEVLAGINEYMLKDEKTPMSPRKYGEMMARNRQQKREKWNTRIQKRC